MKKVIGFLGDRAMVRDEDSGEYDNTLDMFVDDIGAVRAFAKDDPNHPENGPEPAIPGALKRPAVPSDDPEDVVDSGDQGTVG